MQCIFVRESPHFSQSSTNFSHDDRIGRRFRPGLCARFIATSRHVPFTHPSSRCFYIYTFTFVTASFSYFFYDRWLSSSRHKVVLPTSGNNGEQWAAWMVHNRFDYLKRLDFFFHPFFRRFSRTIIGHYKSRWPRYGNIAHQLLLNFFSVFFFTRYLIKFFMFYIWYFLTGIN